jgi:hypothetical protein
MARTKAQEGARNRRIERAAQALHMVAEPRQAAARLMFKGWKELSKAEKDRYRSMVQVTVEAFEASKDR